VISADISQYILVCAVCIIGCICLKVSLDYYLSLLLNPWCLTKPLTALSDAYVVKCPHTAIIVLQSDATLDGLETKKEEVGRSRTNGTRFTCFTSIKVQILMLKALQVRFGVYSSNSMNILCLLC
jgi:hypothetical protein